jgi:hypothetical protein
MFDPKLRTLEGKKGLVIGDRQRSLDRLDLRSASGR